jgi:polyhydroxybutyrate depolymerase
VKRKWLWLIVGVVVGLPFVLILVAFVSYQIADRRSGTLVVAGETREYLLHVPESYDAARATPLVISLHGTGLWPAGQSAMSGWNAVADEEGFIVVYPSATSISPVGWPKLWRAWEEISGSNDTIADLRFISDLIDALDAEFNIDPTRIYANGYSSGGAMANLLACRLARGTSAMSGDDPWDSVRRWTAAWAQRNGCGRTAGESAIAADVMRLEYSDCESGAIVVLYTVEDGGHTWPGSDPPEWMSGMAGRTTDSIDATRAIWSFFRERPKT